LAVSTPAFAAPRGVKSLGDEARQAKWALKATVTIAPKLAVILHRMWIDQTESN
jgi:hypothetical protein